MGRVECYTITPAKVIQGIIRGIESPAQTLSTDIIPVMNLAAQVFFGSSHSRVIDNKDHVDGTVWKRNAIVNSTFNFHSDPKLLLFLFG